MGKPLIIFDFDGVIVDTVDFLEEEIRRKLTELGYDFMDSEEEALALFEENIIVALIQHGLTPQDMCAVWEHIEKATKEADVKPCRGVPEMLDALKLHCDMAIVSSNSTETIASLLERLGMTTYFFKVSGGDEAAGKSVRIKACMEEMGGNPALTFYVGDTVGDVSEAKEAGVGSLAVSWGMHPYERLAQASPDCILREPSELLDLVRAFAGEEESSPESSSMT